MRKASNLGVRGQSVAGCWRLVCARVVRFTNYDCFCARPLLASLSEREGLSDFEVSRPIDFFSICGNGVLWWVFRVIRRGFLLSKKQIWFF
jgi:hypothetical protein